MFLNLNNGLKCDKKLYMCLLFEAKYESKPRMAQVGVTLEYDIFYVLQKALE